MPKKKKRTYNVRRIRLNQSHSVQDIAELFNIHKNAVLRWIKDGLPIIDQRKPYLIYGAELAEYLRKKQNKRKSKCQPNEFFCCKCRKPQKAWENLVDIEIRNKNQLSISGICDVCETSIHKAGATRNLASFQKLFSVHTLRGEHIVAGSNPSVNSDMRKEDEND